MLDLITAYTEAIIDTDRDGALKIVRDAVAGGVSAEEIVFSVVMPAMDTMIRSVSEEQDASLAQHFMTAHRFKKGHCRVRPRGENRGRRRSLPLRPGAVQADPDTGKPGGKFLFGRGVMLFGIPEENIRAMLDAAYEYGRY